MVTSVVTPSSYGIVLHYGLSMFLEFEKFFVFYNDDIYKK